MQLLYRLGDERRGCCEEFGSCGGVEGMWNFLATENGEVAFFGGARQRPASEATQAPTPASST